MFQSLTNLGFDIYGASNYSGDLDEITDSGLYRRPISNSATNGPGFYAYLLVFRGGTSSSTRYTQVAFGYNVARIAIRYFGGTAWSDWTIFS